MFNTGKWHHYTITATARPTIVALLLHCFSSMSDDDSDQGAASDAGSCAGSDVGGEPVFDPSSLNNLSEKDRKKWEQNLSKWRVFLDFLVRHVAIATFKYNCFEKDDLQAFMQALERAEYIRKQTKLKKGEVARITNFKSMKDVADLLTKQQYLNEAHHIRTFLDLAGRMRGISMIAGGFFKALKKGNVVGLEKLKHYLDFWKGFCVRSYDYSELTFKGTDPERFNDLERKHLVWPTVIRTAINLAQKFLKRASESTGLELINADPKVQQRHMQAAEFIVAARIEDMLFTKVVQETKTFLLGRYILLETQLPFVLI